MIGSVVMVNSEKAEVLIRKILIEKWPVVYSDVLQYNPSVEKLVILTVKREYFL